MIQSWLHRLGTNIPEFDTMDEYIEFILRLVRPYSEDLDEREFFLEKRWTEISDRDDDINAVLHIFKPDFSPEGLGRSGDLTYMRVVNGNVSMGVWSSIKNSNSMLIDEGGRFELFDMAFMNGDFIVLKKHRNQHTPVLDSKYLFLARERLVKSGDTVMPWLDIMELWFNVYRLNAFYIGTVVIIILITVFILLLSTI